MFLRTYEVLSKVSFDLMVCDEGHRLKNAAIKTTSVSLLNCAMHLRQSFPCTCVMMVWFPIQILGSVPVQRRIVLTGTPIQVSHVVVRVILRNAICSLYLFNTL